MKIAGKFGGGKYEVDRTNPKNIAIRVKVFLKVAGTGTLTDVQSVKQMEDGIEKAASAKGFIVDIEFVSMPGSDAFEVDVSPGEWETATNWSGGEPLGFAHELFHLMYYEVDRYDYIATHSTNQSMMIPDRIAWFLAQLKKPAGWDNPASIMAGGSHPLDDDICRVAGLPEADCIKSERSHSDVFDCARKKWSKLKNTLYKRTFVLVSSTHNRNNDTTKKESRGVQDNGNF